MALAIYAIKCNVSLDELRADAYSFQEYLNLKSPTNPFTDEDIESALECYNETYRSFPRDDIAKITGIEIQKNKRHGRSQEKHLQGARAIRDINNENWRKGNVRKSAQYEVFAFLDKNPNATAKDLC